MDGRVKPGHDDGEGQAVIRRDVITGLPIVITGLPIVITGLEPVIQCLILPS